MRLTAALPIKVQKLRLDGAKITSIFETTKEKAGKLYV
jgi:hypothetical protein